MSKIRKNNNVNIDMEISEKCRINNVMIKTNAENKENEMP